MQVVARSHLCDARRNARPVARPTWTRRSRSSRITFRPTASRSSAAPRFGAAGCAANLPRPTKSCERDMYALAIDRLTAAGFEHYEVSNFARPGCRSRHNQVYWSGDGYFAAGPGAARYVDGVRETNHRSTTTYLQRVLAGESPVAEREAAVGRKRGRGNCWCSACGGSKACRDASSRAQPALTVDELDRPSRCGSLSALGLLGRRRRARSADARRTVRERRDLAGDACERDAKALASCVSCTAMLQRRLRQLAGGRAARRAAAAAASFSSAHISPLRLSLA